MHFWKLLILSRTFEFGDIILQNVSVLSHVEKVQKNVAKALHEVDLQQLRSCCKHLQYSFFVALKQTDLVKGEIMTQLMNTTKACPFEKWSPALWD
jgi:hypothetical protein